MHRLIIVQDAPWHILYPRERVIIERQLRGDTLSSIAHDLGISRGRVHAIRDRALRILSHESRLRRRRLAAYAINPQAFTTDP